MNAALFNAASCCFSEDEAAQQGSEFDSSVGLMRSFPWHMNVRLFGDSRWPPSVCLFVHVRAHLSLSPDVGFPWWPWLGISDGWMVILACVLCPRWWASPVFFPLQFPMGPGSDGPLGAMAGMEPHHMNGSLGNKCTHSSTYLMSSSGIIVASTFLGSSDLDGMNKVNVGESRRD